MQATTQQVENSHFVYQNLVSQPPFHCARIPLCQALRTEGALGRPRHHNTFLLTRCQQPRYSFIAAVHLARRRIICIVCGLYGRWRDGPLQLDLWGEKAHIWLKLKRCPGPSLPSTRSS